MSSHTVMTCSQVISTSLRLHNLPFYLLLLVSFVVGAPPPHVGGSLGLLLRHVALPGTEVLLV